MTKSLIIIESPGKLKKIKSILGSSFLVEASGGHIRNLHPNNLSIDIENDFKPSYFITDNRKKETINQLKKLISKIDNIYIASDPDREGEAIAKSLIDELKLKPNQYKKIVFNEITKKAIEKAIKNPIELNENLVKAQETRRILDRLIGYQISPILKPLYGSGSSAGRVKSVIVKLITEKEKEIQNFMKENVNNSFFKFSGEFKINNDEIKANMFSINKKTEIAKIKNDEELIIQIFKKCRKSIFTINDIINKEKNVGSPPPFMTATMQQEASKKFKFSTQQTMDYAQKLYEKGYITYLRTDSVELSDDAHKSIKVKILNNYGENYYQYKQYKQKDKNAQEAHEAIRPCEMNLENLKNKEDDKGLQKLYELIWTRTMASQMKPAIYDQLIINVNGSKLENYFFQSHFEKLVFLGHLILNKTDNIEDNTVENKKFKKGDILDMVSINAKQDYERPSTRYNEADLVGTMQKMSIGRPATVASSITNIFEKNYVKKSNFEGYKKKIITYILKNNSKNLDILNSEITIGEEKDKICPTELGTKITEYLDKNFDNIMDFKFTAKMEDELNDIANGKKEWLNVMKNFYKDFEPKLLKLQNENNIIKKDRDNKTKLIGIDERDNLEIYYVHTRKGPCLRKIDDDGEHKYASFDGNPDELTIEYASKLFNFPLLLGKYNNNNVYLKKGKYGLYVECDGNKNSVEDIDITLNDAIQKLDEKKSNIIKEIKKGKNIYRILNGKYGPYINLTGTTNNYKIPKNFDINKINTKNINDLIKK